MEQHVQRGKPVQILTANTDGTFELNTEALATILLAPNLKDKPVVVVSVAGAFRKGKSFLLDFFLRYMLSGGQEGWLGEPNAPLSGFTWRGGCDGDTTGILLWNEVFLVTSPEGKQLAVILMDTQGTFDCKSTVQGCATIFALSTMTSSVQVYNLSQNIQEDDLQNLEYFTEYGRLAQEVQQCTVGKPFQKLLFLVRDWSYPYQAKFGAEGGSKILEKRLEITKDQPKQLQSLRLRIKSCFEEIGCFLMPHPGLRVATEESFDGRLSDIEKMFQEQLEVLVPSLLAPDKLLVKHVNGQEITCKKLLGYFKAYVEIFKDGQLPEPQSALQMTAQVNNLQAMTASRDAYNSAMEKICGKDQPYLSSGKLQDHHNREKMSAIELFSRTPKMGGEQFSKAYLDKLEKEIERAFFRFAERNDQKAMRRTFLVLTAISAATLVATGGFLFAGVLEGAVAFGGVTSATHVIAHVRNNISSSGRWRRLRTAIDGAANGVWDAFAQGIWPASRRAADATVHVDEETEPLLGNGRRYKDD